MLWQIFMVLVFETREKGKNKKPINPKSFD